MNCPHCGNPISSADRFCPNCGADLGVEKTIISRMPPPLPDIPTVDRPGGAEETIVSRMPPPAPPPPSSPAYEPPPAPPTYPTVLSPKGEKGGRNVTLIVAVVLILLCCCCLIAVLAAYMLLSEGMLDELLRQISLALLLV
jgi:hypothetical protein